MTQPSRPSRRTLVIIGVVVALAAAGTAIGLTAGGGKGKPSTAPSSPSLSPSASPTSPAPSAAPVTCPLTGRPPAAGMNPRRVALAVKIDNVDIARPQTGIDHADVVFEETVEGGLTRLFAVFQCDSAPTLGPVRSARTSDRELLLLLKGGAVFGYSGSNNRVKSVIYSTPGIVPLSYDANGGLYYRGNGRPAPHNVYTSTATLLRAGLARRHSMRAPQPLFVYSAKPAGGAPVKSLALRWSGYASAAWTWTGNKWARTQNGTPDVLTNHTRVHADNVVVMRIKTRFVGLHDVLGNPSPDDVITGGGRVWVFRQGRYIIGHWSRPTVSARLRLLDSHGRLIRLLPGHTWIELLPSPGTLRIT